jgi:hypothetical protein
VATLNVPCFRYLGQDITAPLAVEDGTGEQFVRCPVRQRPFRVTPEEGVRQALIWFLLEGSNRAAALGEHLRFGVEERSLDVAGFFAGSVLDERFRPSVTVAILETKRPEEELADHAGQLQTYMQRDRCRSGLLFNGRQAVWLTLDGDFADPQWTAEVLPDLREAEQHLELASHAANAHLGHCRSLFMAAAGGNFDSLVQLASLFCEDQSLIFALSVRARGSLGLVQACAVQVSNPNLLTYRTRGVTTRKRQELSRDGFHALISVRPLWS